MLLLSIDASTKSSGVAVFKQDQLIDYKCITQPESEIVYDRINKMVKEIVNVYLKYKPNKIIMEEVLPQDVNHNQNTFKALIYLQAAIAMALYEYKIRVQFIVSSHWRKICGIKTGKGIKRESLKNASKKLVKEKYNIDVNDDISDAICLGIAYLKENNIQASAF